MPRSVFKGGKNASPALAGNNYRTCQNTFVLNVLNIAALTQCSASVSCLSVLLALRFSMAIGTSRYTGKGWVPVQLLEKDLLEKVSVGLQGTECGFCTRGWGWAPGGLFPRGKLCRWAEWLGKRDKEGADGCGGDSLGGWAALGAGVRWELCLPSMASGTPHTAF